MNVQNRKSEPPARASCRADACWGLEQWSPACWVICCRMCGRIEAIVLPGDCHGLVGFGVALYGRARSRQEWSAAWDAYAEREVARKCGLRSMPDETLVVGRHERMSRSSPVEIARIWPFVPWRLCVQYANDGSSATEVNRQRELTQGGTSHARTQPQAW